MDEQFRMPPEWAPHDAVWTAWPSQRELWRENLDAAQTEFVELCRAITERGGERVQLFVNDARAGAEAERRLAGVNVKFHLQPFGDIWFRDTAPLFLTSPRLPERRHAARFKFNGWGGKYLLPHDDAVAAYITQATMTPETDVELVLEGGSVEVDGEGTCLTSRQCLLNQNRNPGVDPAEIERRVLGALGAEKMLWLEDGLVNDHTDGHIDTIARFVAPGEVACMCPDDEQDPNQRILRSIERDLGTMTDARGRKLKVHRVPSPGRVVNAEGDVMPASYLNFYIGNKTVVVPTYGQPNDARAVQAIAALFPDRRVVGRSAFAILSGGGAFHCITQQQPRAGV